MSFYEFSTDVVRKHLEFSAFLLFVALFLLSYALVENPAAWVAISGIGTAIACFGAELLLPRAQWKFLGKERFSVMKSSGKYDVLIREGKFADINSPDGRERWLHLGYHGSDGSVYTTFVILREERLSRYGDRPLTESEAEAIGREDLLVC